MRLRWENADQLENPAEQFFPQRARNGRSPRDADRMRDGISESPSVDISCSNGGDTIPNSDEM